MDGYEILIIPGIVLLLIVNVPVYFAVGWLVFDTSDYATQTIWETTVSMLKIIFIPPMVRMMFGMDDHDGVGMFHVFAFFATCVLITAGEIFLIAYLFGWLPAEAAA